MNLEWERRRRDAREEEQQRRSRETEERKHRMELRQKSKQEETDRRKVEERRRQERENLAGLREALGSLRKNDKLDVQVTTFSHQTWKVWLELNIISKEPARQT